MAENQSADDQVEVRKAALVARAAEDATNLKEDARREEGWVYAHVSVCVCMWYVRDSGQKSRDTEREQ